MAYQILWLVWMIHFWPHVAKKYLILGTFCGRMQKFQKLNEISWLENNWKLRFVITMTKFKNFKLFKKHPKLYFVYLSNQILLRGRFVLKTNGRMSSIIWNKDHCCSFFTSWVIKQQTKLYIEHIEKTPKFGHMVRTLKIVFRVLQIISMVFQVPIFRNNFYFGWKAFTFSVRAL